MKRKRSQWSGHVPRCNRAGDGPIRTGSLTTLARIPAPSLKNGLVVTLIAMMLSSCTLLVGETPTDSSSPTGSTPRPTTVPSGPQSRQCVHFTGSGETLATGSTPGDALHLSGEIFTCADDVVVVDAADLNRVAAAAQLAAALGGPLLFPDPRLAAELGRLKPERVHLLSDLEIHPPLGAEVRQLSIGQAVEEARRALRVSQEVRLPSTPDATTVIETVGAIIDRDRVVLPQTVAGSTSTAQKPDLESEAILRGLAQPSASETVWLIDAGDPVEILMAAALGRSVGVVAVAFDPADVLGHPEIGNALAGRPPQAIRFVGSSPSVSDWELQVLSHDVQLPGGGFRVFPANQKRRYVALYGHPKTTALGALGEQGPEATVQRLQPFLTAYEGDGSQTIPTFEMLASVASGPIDDGDYSFEWPVETYAEWIRFAHDNGVYVILDLQPGRDDFLNQAKQYEELLKLPFVGLALDPEWRLAPDQIHLRQIGRVDAAEVNRVVDWLADLVRDNGLPQKMIIVHQFREFMIQNRATLETRPELQMVIQMDGDGTEAQKDNTYAALTRGTEGAHWVWGWKNFFDEDEPGPPSPESTMGKIPTPVYVSYQ